MNKIITITVLIFAAILALGLYAKSNKPPVVPIDASTVLEIKADDHVVGNPESPVVFVEYLDLQCPACAAFHPIMDQVKAANEDIAIVTRHFPLPFHRNARIAGAAAEAAGQQGKFSQMVSMQFEGQQLWSALGAGAASDIFESYAVELGLDIDAFNEYRISDMATSKVSNDYNGGVAAGVNSTPTFMLQGQKIQARSVEEFQQLIDVAKQQAVEAPVDTPETTEEVDATTTETDL